MRAEEVQGDKKRLDKAMVAGKRLKKEHEDTIKQIDGLTT
jgi:hypothetical protein